MWAFDDPAVGLNKEPFISEIDTMIDRMTFNIPGAERGVFALCLARRHSFVIPKNSSGDGRSPAATGITAITTRYKAGSALPF